MLQLSLVSRKRTFCARGNEIHYIGGTEILPAPLDAVEEQKMIHMLGTSAQEEARSKLIERNLRLVVYIAKKFDNTGIGVEDLISIGTIGLIKAINTFNPAKKIKLATYASRCIENEILMYLRRKWKYPSMNHSMLTGTEMNCYYLTSLVQMMISFIKI